MKFHLNGVLPVHNHKKKRKKKKIGVS
jgi:hypothetical protein